MIPKNCGECRFYRLLPWSATGNEGTCRRRAPRIRENDDGDPIAVWPIVTDHDWCGEVALVHRQRLHRMGTPLLLPEQQRRREPREQHHR